MTSLFPFYRKGKAVFDDEDDDDPATRKSGISGLVSIGAVGIDRPTPDPDRQGIPGNVREFGCTENIREMSRKLQDLYSVSEKLLYSADKH